MTQSQKSMELIWSLARGDDVNAHKTNEHKNTHTLTRYECMNEDEQKQTHKQPTKQTKMFWEKGTLVV